jgi:ABC-type iron transport system FetAB ATPase subunit
MAFAETPNFFSKHQKNSQVNLMSPPHQVKTFASNFEITKNPTGALGGRTLNKRIKRVVTYDDDNVVIEKKNVSPKDLKRSKFDSQISFVHFKQSVKGLSLYGDLAPPTTIKQVDGYQPVKRELVSAENKKAPEKRSEMPKEQSQVSL